MSYNIFHSLLINASKQEVFNAVSLPEHLDNWWTLKSFGKPKLGETYNLNFTDEYDWFCQVTVCKSNDSFYLKMTNSDKDWNPTTFGFDLEEQENGTYLNFSHVDWAETNFEFKNSSFCWAMLLFGLKNYLEKGIIIPFEERN